MILYVSSKQAKLFSDTYKYGKTTYRKDVINTKFGTEVITSGCEVKEGNVIREVLKLLICSILSI